MAKTAAIKLSAVRDGKVHPLLTQLVPIDDHCIGDRWSVQDEMKLARLVAVIAMGQAAYAAYIIRELIAVTPAFNDDDLRRQARIRLTVQEIKKTPREGYPRWQRDGFIFEAISWIAARQTYGSGVLLKDPHISATSQGLDGLMIELADDKSTILSTTVFEDKCTDNPRDTFLQKVIPAFMAHHQNMRSAELVATASVLLRMAGIGDAAAARLAAAVMDRKQRQYRAAFALTSEQDGEAERQRLFNGYDAIDDISAEQRIGASLILDGEVRGSLDALASNAIAYLGELTGVEV